MSEKIWILNPEWEHAQFVPISELRQANERIKQLESWIASLDKLVEHSGKSENREWFGSEIGWLHKGHVVYLGEAKP